MIHGPRRNPFFMTLIKCWANSSIVITLVLFTAHSVQKPFDSLFFFKVLSISNMRKSFTSALPHLLLTRGTPSTHRKPHRRALYCTILTAKIKAERSQLEKNCYYYSLSLVKHHIPIHPRHTQSTFIVGRGIHPFASTGALRSSSYSVWVERESRVREHFAITFGNFKKKKKKFNDSN